MQGGSDSSSRLNQGGLKQRATRWQFLEETKIVEAEKRRKQTGLCVV